MTGAVFVVTSQEDIDSLVGEMTPSKVNDFSKIQKRFRSRRMSLYGANVYEVIRARVETPTAASRCHVSYPVEMNWPY